VAAPAQADDGPDARVHTDSELVFPSGRTGLRIMDIKTGFRTALDRAKLSNFRFHHLRHTWATRAADCHVPEPVRRDIMCHRSDTMTGDYTHAMLETMEEAMELVANYRGRAAAGPAKSRQSCFRGRGCRPVLAVGSTRFETSGREVGVTNRPRASGELAFRLAWPA
jgi:hypothetical protein